MGSMFRIILNVGGVRHETYKHTLKKIPATRLSRYLLGSAALPSQLDIVTLRERLQADAEPGQL